MMGHFSRYIGLFLAFTVILIPFSWSLFDWIFEVQNLILLPLTVLLAEIFHLDPILFDLSSDSLLFVLIFPITAFFSFILYLIIHYRHKWSDRKTFYTQVILIHFLAIILFKYGLDKVFKHQFFLPEPNTLNTRLGQLDKDILFWSTIGSSYFYNLITGALEVIAGFMILSSKVRTKGLMLSFFILCNILLINLSFNISVKFFTIFLILINIFLYIFSEHGQITSFSILNFRTSRYQLLLNIFFLFLFLFEGMHPYLSSGNFNDDLHTRPSMHGSYRITDTSATLDRICIHRDGYFILMKDGSVQGSYQMKMKPFQKNDITLIDLNGNELSLTIKRQFKENFIFDLVSPKNKDRLRFNTLKERMEDYPLLRSQFSWIID